mmetsp:Transcript_16596/g.36375  ORF Transcript_16596/g.36375 Transcript_16596/m.36375 type:complete len:136 (+) Transcript_16596:224-631(+)|eukprot:CAMPEP_0170595616 /NCGR_PEP_ID=MMETSP0224-20130122/14661_1 /TAXON_ID=285029 /ORGANISM="Togula jolla, Strain CCCM 725" /LENGTH=135 /DNA_ID=CAMNT_0010919817 /DNA_START=223 /DNA_END=630 /DNA_ORIENTATION=-
MKPAWDQLMAEFKDSPTSLVADVDCTTEGKDLCETHGVQGFPTIKYGDPADLKDYSGGRDFESLKAFASEHLGPQCGPEHMDLCDDKTKAKIEGYLKMSVERMEGKIRNAQKLLQEEAPIMHKVIAHLKKNKNEL